MKHTHTHPHQPSSLAFLHTHTYPYTCGCLRALHRHYHAAFCVLYLCSALVSFWNVRAEIVHQVHKLRVATAVATFFVALTLPISVYHTFQHLSYFVDSNLQAQVVRIVWMVPVYAVQSLLSLSFMRYSFYFQALREFYESFVIYCFLRFLVYYLGEERQLERTLALMSAHIGKHKPPFCCIPSWTMGSPFLNNCKFGVLQYVVIRFLSALIAFVLEYLGLYSEGLYALHSSFFWLTMLDISSQTWALYSLLLFYHATHKELLHIKPFGKFMCIKAVVFASWWQAIVIGILVRHGYIGDLEDGEYLHSAAEVADVIQELLICMEMFIAAIAFYLAFPVADFMPKRSYSQISMPTPTPEVLSPTLAGTSKSTRKVLVVSPALDHWQAVNSIENLKSSRSAFYTLRGVPSPAFDEFKEHEDSDSQGVSELVMLELQTGMGMQEQDEELSNPNEALQSYTLAADTSHAPSLQRILSVGSQRNRPFYHTRAHTRRWRELEVNTDHNTTQPHTHASVLEALRIISVPMELEEDLRLLGTHVMDDWVRSAYRKWIRTRAYEHTGS